MRLVTWNILFADREDRLGLLIERLRALRPDVVALQETSAAHARQVATALGLTAQVAEFDRPEAEIVTTAILADEAAEHRQIALGEHPYARSATILRLPRHDDLTLVSAHLDATPDAINWALHPAQWSERFAATAAQSRQARLRQLELLSGEIAAERAILVGDLNFMPDSAEYQWCTAHGWRDSWRAAARFQAATTICADNPFLRDEFAQLAGVLSGPCPGAAPGGYTLDYQFVRGAITPGSAWTVGWAPPGAAWPSDHLGLVVDY